MIEAGDFESRIFAFECAWQDGVPPVITEVLSSLNSRNQQDRLRLLIELVCLDLEYRWRAAAKTQTAVTCMYLENYAQMFPELESLDDLPLELIGEEYRVRQLWGDCPDHSTFLARFDHRLDEIGILLRQIDDELQNEEKDSPEQTPISAITSKQSSAVSDPRAPLAYTDYLLQRMVGAGRMGKVFCAWQRSLDRPVAVKYLRKEFLQHDAAVERFITEAQMVARLSHPGIVGIHGLGRTPAGGYFITMELIDGSDLADIVNKNDSADVDKTVQWMNQACDAIAHAHEHGIIHCDLKPGNILLDQEGRVHITDFGLARSVVDDTRVEDCIEGTAPFMSPEQVTKYWGPISPRTDVYGLGAVLYTLLTGQPPFRGLTIADILSQVVSAAPVVRPETIRSDVPNELSDICMRCLARTPGDRFGTVEELRAALSASNL